MNRIAFHGLILAGAFSVLFMVLGSPTIGQNSKEIAALEETLTGVAPMAVLKNSTLIAFTKEGKPKVLRKGTNGFRCLDSVTGNKICADKNSLDFFTSRLKKKNPPPGKIGFAYMLLGDKGDSMTDPFAQSKTANNHWVVGGPHVMISGTVMDGYPEGASADPTQPYVMWPGTPWAHLMIPIE